MPMSTAPVNDTGQPAKSREGKPSRRIHPAKIAIRIGPMLTSIAAVPATIHVSAAMSETL